jgi:hypothetical protein
VQLAGYERHVITMADGSRGLNVRYMMKHNPRRWDKIPDLTANPVVYRQIATDADANSDVYEPGDVIEDGTLLFNVGEFNDLFKPAA